ncbi:MAG: UTP--glucose-1-phosphate uridylyltransferase [Chloroflexi bacterium RBG_13_57_8]|nr:MAG: UTP--glucose-1-phosphate uridylyltransferase [Chloroflexi bacterium RBG_13_57_8]
MKVRKAVIIAAGRGTRFLPITRSQPKEMMPLIDRPLVQYGVEEALNSGITQIIMVTAHGKSTMEDYFDRALDLEYFLEQKGDQERLKQMRQLAEMADVCYVRQKEQLGLGHAIMTARPLVGDEPFAVILPDDIIDSEVPCLKSMVAVYEKYGGGVIAVERVKDEDTVKYGIIKAKPVEAGGNVYLVNQLVEKPEPSWAPSRLGIVGRYVLPAQIFDALEVTPRGTGNEIQVTDALHLLLQQQELYAYEFEGVRYDTGTPLGWLKANIALALKRADMGPELRDYLKKLA